ncbi:hypothetical protein E4K72_01325 [Oxalobacteraceae bacterium OM1]|nr:hypothetical protein E4K72_01325 [Oxalobacteraceae bacterium OM1]
MSVCRWIIVAVFSCALMACAGAPGVSDRPAPTAQAHQVLVMLRMPPQHFQAGTEYAGGYGTDPGHRGRRRIAAALAREYGLELGADWPMPALGIDCFVMESSPAESAERIVEILSRDPRVAWAQPVHRFRTMGGGDPLFPLQPSAQYWHLADIHALTTGRNVRVAIVDSGIDTAHPDLAGQVVDEQNFVDDGRHVAEAHGTAVAGIIAAKSDNGIGIAGIAPHARLLAMRACWEVAADDTECSSFTLGKALHAALLRDAQVINLSLTGPADPLVGRLLDVALARNIKVIAAADPRSADGGFPARHPGVLAVGDESTRVGMVAGLPTLIAPGHDIPTTLPGARWDFVSGASYAAAHVSGLIALLTELRPALPAAEMRRAIAAAPAGAATATVDPCGTFLRLTATCACHPCLTSHTADAQR